MHPSPNIMLELAWAVRVPRVDAVKGSAGGVGCLYVWRDVELVRLQEKPGGGNRAHLHFRTSPAIRQKPSQPAIRSNPQDSSFVMQPRTTLPVEKKPEFIRR